MHVLGLLSHLDQRRFEPFLICSPGILATRARDIEGILVHEVTFRSKFDFAAQSGIGKILSEIQTHDNPFRSMIVHTHGPRAGFIGRRATPKGVYKVYTEHIWNRAYHLENKVNEWLQKRALRSLNYKTDMIIAVSNAVKDFLVQNKLAPDKRVIVIPNGIDLSEHKSQNTEYRASHGHQPPVIGTVGNLNIQKGHQYLIEAMPMLLPRYPHLMLEIIGEGDERENMEAIIQDMHLQRNITLLGRGKANYLSKMAKWNVFVLPSISETFGIAVLEAMEMGVPVVATKVGGVPDIISDKKNGLFVEPKNPRQIAKAVSDLLDHPAEAAKLSRAGKETVKKFDWRVVIKEIESVYTNLAKDKF
jgi:glycosyltransferase involved in cell wall biosynthesis